MKITNTVPPTFRTLALAGAIGTAILLQSCSGAEGFPDGRVNPYAFNAATNAELSTEVISDSITVSGIDIPVDIAITGPAGSNAAYSINDGPFTSERGKVENGQTVRIRVTTGAEEGSQTSVALSIGDRSATFTVSTIGSTIPELISAAGATNVRLSVAGNGTAIAVFVDADNIMANHYDGISWSTPVEIDASDSAAAAPDIATDANGNAIAVWGQDDGLGENTIFASYYNAATTTWGSPEEIASNGGWAENSPRVAMNDAGQAVAAWTQWVGVANSTVANVFSNGAWQTSSAIEDADDSMTNYSNVRVAIDNNGNAAASWQGEVAGDDGYIYVNRYDANEGWGTHTLAGGLGESFEPAVVFLSTGEAIAAWNQFGTDNQIFTSMTAADANSWSAPAAIGDTTNTNYTGRLQLAADGQGNAMAAYLKNGDQIKATRYLASGGWQSTTASIGSTPIPFGGEGVALALDDAGNGLVIYGTENNIAVSRYSIDSDLWSAPEIVDQGAAPAYAPVADANRSSGQIVFAWEQAGIVAFKHTPENND